jgi:hypothetical protein
MKNIEKYVLIIIVLSLIGTVIPIARDLYITTNISNVVLTENDKAIWTLWRVGLAALVNVGSAIWLFSESRKNSSSSLIWSFFGLTFGLFAVGLFYLVCINNKLSYIKSLNPDAARKTRNAA